MENRQLFRLDFFQVKNQVDIYGQVNGSHANHGERLIGTKLSWIGGLHHLRNIWGPLCTTCACLKSLLDWKMQL